MNEIKDALLNDPTLITQENAMGNRLLKPNITDFTALDHLMDENAECIGKLGPRANVNLFVTNFH